MTIYFNTKLSFGSTFRFRSSVFCKISLNFHLHMLFLLQLNMHVVQKIKFRAKPLPTFLQTTSSIFSTPSTTTTQKPTLTQLVKPPSLDDSDSDFFKWRFLISSFFCNYFLFFRNSWSAINLAISSRICHQKTNIFAFQAAHSKALSITIVYIFEFI